MDRKDPSPDPYVTWPNEVRKPGRELAKTVTLDSTRPVPRMRAHVHATANQSFTNGTPAKVTFSEIDFDTVGLWDNANDRFIIPSTGKVTGPWLVQGCARFDTPAADDYSVSLQIKQNSTVISHHFQAHQALSESAQMHVSILVNDPALGDTFELWANHAAGGTLNLLKTPADVCYFEIIHLW